MNIDEHYFNKKRLHSTKEIWSILIDAFLFLASISFATFVKYDLNAVIIYKTLAGLSMISIIKNEFFFDHLCKGERLVHASLFFILSSYSTSMSLGDLITFKLIPTFG